MPLVNSLSFETAEAPTSVERKVSALLFHPGTPPEGLFTLVEAGLDDTGLSDRYRGTVSASGFRLTRETLSARSFGPQVRGIITGTARGSHISVRAGPSTLDLLVLVLMSLSGIGIGIWLSTEPELRFAWLPCVAGVSVWWVAAVIMSSNQAKRIHRVLTAILNVGPTGA